MIDRKLRVPVFTIARAASKVNIAAFIKRQQLVCRIPDAVEGNKGVKRK